MSFIVIEGLDGAGKSTQLKLLAEWYRKKGVACETLHFPRTDSPFFGELIARFLRGELGNLNEVDPYVVAMLYAGDRRDASDILNRWLSERKTILLDRYVYSNIAFQCAKIADIKGQKQLRDWIYDLEFNYFKIPKPTTSIFLDVPFTFTESRLKSQRKGNDREYLKGSVDIHEEDLNFQRRVRDVYIQQPNFDPLFSVVSCTDSNGYMANKNDIFKRIVSLIEQ
ncbi:MAG TPA: dTMP kinase [Perlabentimonas sp.]|jgi:dTMP kinase|nr:dTMP kinase [Bacteroidales bacterium]MDD4673675.1 dTMP kinase [Bacteroidales bacterium]MDY0349078.1 dTMP kinase [Tenuifilaceae bacterium]HZJ73995.1 dTMP kinase [Perlabentimonas sp.]